MIASVLARYSIGGSLSSLNHSKDKESPKVLVSFPNKSDPRYFADMMSDIGTEMDDRSVWTHGFSDHSVFIVHFDTLMALVHLSVLWVSPMVVAFELYMGNPYSIFVSCMYGLDCIIDLFTLRASHPSMQNIKDPTLDDWRYHYFRHGFIIDFITMMPFELFATPTYNFLWLIKLLRLYKLPTIISTTPKIVNFLKQLSIILGLGSSLSIVLPLLFIVCAFFHVQACCLYLAGRSFGYSSVEMAGVKNASLFQKYTWSLFFAISNTFPSMYTPKEAAEQWIVLCFVIVGAGLYALVVGVISSVAMGVDASGRLYTQKMDELREYMKWKDLNPITRRKVLKYYELKYRGKFFEETTLLGEMNDSLRMEIAAHNCKELISKVSFLNRQQSDGRDELFLGRVASALIACYFVPGDIVFIQGEIGHEMYFILQGSVSVIVGNQKVATLEEGGFFGEVALIGNIPRTATVQTESSCILYRLTRPAFTSILNEFDDVRAKVDVIYKERMEKIREEEEARKLIAAQELISKVEFLRRHENDGRDELFLGRIASALVAVFYCAGDVIFSQGDIGNDMYFVKSGHVEIVVNGKKVTTLKEGSFFGEVALIANIPRTATVQAAVPTMIYRLTRPSFESITAEFQDVMRNVEIIFKERMAKIKLEEEDRKLTAAKELVSKITFLQRGEEDGRDNLFLLRIANSLSASFYVFGDIVFSQGELGHEMYFIKNGKVDIIVGGKVVATLKDGAFFGEVALLANIPRTATVQAASACMLYRLTRSAFEQIVEEFDDVRNRIDVIYQERLEKVNQEGELKKRGTLPR
ncbi:cyclic nucleotide-binding-like protein [Obelidium mucronatum]|nr:cyclic nucleotide-binding-like protein [Obelidium mucronatum]